MKELCRLLSLQLKSDGHGKYSESIRKCMHQFEIEYDSEYTLESLCDLQRFQSQLVPILTNIEKIVVNRAVKDFSNRLTTELDRLISIQEKSTSLNSEEKIQETSSK